MRPATKEEGQALADAIGILSMLDEEGRDRVLRSAAAFFGPIQGEPKRVAEDVRKLRRKHAQTPTDEDLRKALTPDVARRSKDLDQRRVLDEDRKKRLLPGMREDGLEAIALDMENGFDYPRAWVAFWDLHAGAHSMLRCGGGCCPGGCGANAKDDLAAIQDARRGLKLSNEQRRRIDSLVAMKQAHDAHDENAAHASVLGGL